mgnify:CR=1 FL=1
MQPQSYEMSADDRYIEGALKARWLDFQMLVRDIDSFVPRPLTAFQPERDKLLEDLRRHNPLKTEDDLVAYADDQIATEASPDMQYLTNFHDRHSFCRVDAIILSHTLCEALINGILSIGLTHIGLPELFDVLENLEMKSKWLLAPKAISAKYSFPVGAAIHETLNALCKDRNALVHYKASLKVGGSEVLKGSVTKHQPHVEERRWLHRYFNLPYDLADLARLQFPDIPLMFLFRREPIRPVGKSIY